MGVRTNEEILARWQGEPAPLLPVLHAFHDRDGYLSESVLRAVSKAHRIPLADLFGTVTFYHHFSREPGGRDAPRVCTGPVCYLKGARDILDALAGEGAHGMPCAGRCDDPVPVLRGDTALAGLSAQGLAPAPSPPMLRYHSPSQQATESSDASFRMEELPGPAHFPSGANEENYAALGDAVHSYLASLPSTRTFTPYQKEIIAERCLTTFSVSGILSPSVLVSTGERFCEWVDSNYPDARWLIEVPMTAPRTAGGQWSGVGDLLLQLPSDEVVVIDHKSAPIRREHCLAKAATFAEQLRAYCEILRAAGETVRAAFIHFPLAGVLAELQ